MRVGGPSHSSPHLCHPTCANMNWTPPVTEPMNCPERVIPALLGRTHNVQCSRTVLGGSGRDIRGIQGPAPGYSECSGHNATKYAIGTRPLLAPPACTSMSTAAVNNHTPHAGQFSDSLHRTLPLARGSRGTARPNQPGSCL